MIRGAAGCDEILRPSLTMASERPPEVHGSASDDPAAEVSAAVDVRSLWRLRRSRGLVAIAAGVALLITGLWTGAATQRAAEQCRRLASQRLCIGYLQPVQEFATVLWRARLALRGRVSPLLAAETGWQAARDELDAILLALAPLDDALRSRLQTANRIERLSSLWGAVKVTADQASPAELDAQFDRLLRATRELTAHVIAAGQPCATDDALAMAKLIAQTFPELEDGLHDLLLQSTEIAEAPYVDPAAVDARGQLVARLSGSVAEVRRAVAEGELLLVARRRTSPESRQPSLDAALHRFLVAADGLRTAAETDSPGPSIGPAAGLELAAGPKLSEAVGESLLATQALRNDVIACLLQLELPYSEEETTSRLATGLPRGLGDPVSRRSARDAGYVTAGASTHEVYHE